MCVLIFGKFSFQQMDVSVVDNATAYRNYLCWNMLQIFEV